MKVFKLLFLFTLCNYSFGRESYDYTRSTQGVLMGGAYSTLADDAYSVFYNPAILARHSGFSFYPINPSFSVINPLATDVDEGAFDGDISDVATGIMGTPIHAGYSFAPGFKMGRFGFSALVNQRTNFTLRNQASPLLDIDYVYDRGFVLGYGHPISGSYSEKSGGEQLSYGNSLKYIDREELRGNYNIFSPALYDAFETGEIADILSTLGVVESSGWGIDTGIDYIKRTAATEMSLGLSIIDTLTKLNAKDSDKTPSETNMKVHVSGAWKMMIANGIGLVLSAELRDIAKAGSYAKKYRIGSEFKLTPVISLYAGLNSGQYSYGFGLNGGLFKLQAGIYSVDTGVEYGEEISSRGIIYLSLLDFKFDG
jgi:hypothetical protein